ncbi:MAG: DUF1499 domain-containing protein, partial [Pirellulales bacterium]
MRIGLGILAAVIVLPIVALGVLGAMSHRAPELGVVDGRLRPCPGSPNCVSTYAEDSEHHANPLKFTGRTEEAIHKLRSVVEEMPRARVVTASESYLHAEFTSRLFRFVDDVEF